MYMYLHTCISVKHLGSHIHSVQAEAERKFLCVCMCKEKRLFMKMVVIFTNKSCDGTKLTIDLHRLDLGSRLPTVQIRNRTVHVSDRRQSNTLADVEDTSKLLRANNRTVVFRLVQRNTFLDASGSRWEQVGDSGLLGGRDGLFGVGGGGSAGELRLLGAQKRNGWRSRGHLWRRRRLAHDRRRRRAGILSRPVREAQPRLTRRQAPLHRGPR